MASRVAIRPWFRDGAHPIPGACSIPDTARPVAEATRPDFGPGIHHIFVFSRDPHAEFDQSVIFPRRKWDWIGEPATNYDSWPGIL
jgi:hypothetical protein